MLENENLHQKFDHLSKDYLKKVTGSGGAAAIDNFKGGPLHRRMLEAPCQREHQRGTQDYGYRRDRSRPSVHGAESSAREFACAMRA